MKILIIGKNGQLAREFGRYFLNKDINSKAVSHKECDITDLVSLKKAVRGYNPDVVINCAAYNQVDDAEVDYSISYKVNALGVYNLVNICMDVNAFLVHYSTDYVFDGKKENGLYTEDDKPHPINEYGKSKLCGEEWLLESGYEKYLIFRTSWVYGEGKQNFIYKLMNWAKNNDYLKIAYNETSVPTSTKTLVDVTIKAIDNGITGLYHLTNSNYASRYEWAKAILKFNNINKFILPVSKEIFNLPAKRPDFSAMSNKKISKAIGIEIPSWEDELERFVKHNN